MRDRIEVSEAAAAVLNRPRIQAVVAALIDQDCTMAQLVARTDMSYSLLSHHLRRLVALGLVRVVGQLPRAGRASPLYRAASRSYFIPAAWCKALPGEQLARDMRQALQQSRSPLGLLLSSDGRPRLQLVFGDAPTDTLELWLRLRLSAPAARRFNEELRALFERWRDQASPKGTSYLVHAALARAK